MGVLLARVLLDGKVKTETAKDSGGHPTGTYPVPVDPLGEFNPIIQSQSSTVVITWRVGIVSVGREEKVLNPTEVSTMSSDLSKSLTKDYQIIRKTPDTPAVASEVSEEDLARDLESKIVDSYNVAKSNGGN